jgi:hypothetical protein
MNAHQVAEVLKEMVLPTAPGPHGFLIHSGIYKDYRIERGSGIAGRGDIWSLKEVRSGERIGPPCRTKAELKLVLREWAAFLEWGQKPGPGYFARRHKTRLNDGYIWVKRVARLPRARKLPDAVAESAAHTELCQTRAEGTKGGGE